MQNTLNSEAIKQLSNETGKICYYTHLIIYSKDFYYVWYSAKNENLTLVNNVLLYNNVFLVTGFPYTKLKQLYNIKSFYSVTVFFVMNDISYCIQENIYQK